MGDDARSRDEDDLALITDAARQAAAIALRFFRNDPKVWYKEGHSPVSEADVAVDAFLERTLVAARPRYGWVSEETERRPGAGSRFFVVDPIDGTRCFLRGEEAWCISIAVVENERPVAGVVYAPVKHEELTARCGGTALCNGSPIAVTPPPETGVLRLSAPDRMQRKLDHLPRLDFQTNAPSLAYRLSLVAMGRLDGTLIRARANDWDIAAGDLILERAGGLLIDVEGRQRVYKFEGKRHGLLVAAARHALDEFQHLGRLVDDA
ncbi:inositol monophosphatase family protein [Consotaella aegiceratis]|uniref:inositol monophosphatase family protein n=1 Tax=Consotaella aegiceratis TaxID=3097961 RepID=UPI002F42F2BA